MTYYYYLILILSGHVGFINHLGNDLFLKIVVQGPTRQQVKACDNNYVQQSSLEVASVLCWHQLCKSHPKGQQLREDEMACDFLPPTTVTVQHTLHMLCKTCHSLDKCGSRCHR